MMVDKNKVEEAAHEYFRKGQLGLSEPNSESGFKAGVEFAEKELSNIAADFKEQVDFVYLKVCESAKNI